MSRKKMMKDDVLDGDEPGVGALFGELPMSKRPVYSSTFRDYVCFRTAELAYAELARRAAREREGDDCAPVGHVTMEDCLAFVPDVAKVFDIRPRTLESWLRSLRRWRCTRCQREGGCPCDDGLMSYGRFVGGNRSYSTMMCPRFNGAELAEFRELEAAGRRSIQIRSFLAMTDKLDVSRADFERAFAELDDDARESLRGAAHDFSIALEIAAEARLLADRAAAAARELMVARGATVREAA